MILKSIQLSNFRSFAGASDVLELGSINVFIGANNSGKSSILKAIHLLQEGSDFTYSDVRLGSNQAIITYDLRDGETNDTADIYDNYISASHRKIVLELITDDYKTGVMSIAHEEDKLTFGFGGDVDLKQRPAKEPKHFIVPFLSRRKIGSFNEDVKLSNATTVTSSMANLSAKLARLSSDSFPGSVYYKDACRKIIGFVVDAVSSDNGSRPGVYISQNETLKIDQMGEGIPNIVSLLVELATAEGKLFIIEEPENDLHPSALKALLELIIESSSRNQFCISTHSNIVLCHLGSEKASKIFQLTSLGNKQPFRSEARLVENTAESRLRILRDLGYSFSDFDLWDGWLILEESSAERIVRDYLVPWFVPKLSRVRTMAANGADDVAPRFRDFDRLTRFTHLEEAYRGAAWVRLDGDEKGKGIVATLRADYSGWPTDRFACYTSDQFENYYPAYFKDRIDELVARPSGPHKTAAKKVLLQDVLAWLDEDAPRGRSALEDSAAEIISDLRVIERQLFHRA